MSWNYRYDYIKFSDLEREYVFEKALKILEFDNYLETHDVKRTLDDGNAYFLCSDLSVWNNQIKKYYEDNC